MMSKGVRFPASPALDVVAYEVTIVTTPTVVKTYDDDASIADPNGDPDMRQISFVGDPDFASLDGDYPIQVRAIDDAGNPSPPSEGVISLDFVAPDPPGELTFF